MLNKENVMNYLRMVAEARAKFIEEIRSAVCNYDCALAGLMSAFAIDIRFEDHKRLDELSTVEVAPEILGLVDKDSCEIVKDGRLTYRRVKIDGITLEAYYYGSSEGE